jgi:hypothetical protein
VQQGQRSKNIVQQGRWDLVQQGERSKDTAQQELTTIHLHIACDQNVFKVHQYVPVNTHNPCAKPHT